MYIIFGNYGDNTIAVLQWAFLRQLQPVTVVHIETGWGATAWLLRVTKGLALAQKYNFAIQALKPAECFEKLIQDRGSFPNAKYQWCATFLKALPLLTWLDQVDPGCMATIVLGSRRVDSRARSHLQEFVKESEYYGGRDLWFPLYNTTNQERAFLLEQVGFKELQTRTLECNPCIHARYNDFSEVDNNRLQQIHELELDLSQTMFQADYPDMNIFEVAQKACVSPTATLEGFDLGCGSRFVCGE